MTHASSMLGVLVAALLPLGCHDGLTEVVLVATGDLPSTDYDSVLVLAAPGSEAPGMFNQVSAPTFMAFPMSFGFTSDGNTATFSATVQLTKVSPGAFSTQVVLSRSVTDVQFTPEQTRMLVLPLLTACACHGTSCPNPGDNPDCDTMGSPATQPLDPRVAPPSSIVIQSGPGGIAGASGGLLKTPPPLAFEAAVDAS